MRLAQSLHLFQAISSLFLSCTEVVSPTNNNIEKGVYYYDCGCDGEAAVLKYLNIFDGVMAFIQRLPIHLHCMTGFPAHAAQKNRKQKKIIIKKSPAVPSRISTGTDRSERLTNCFEERTR